MYLPTLAQTVTGTPATAPTHPTPAMTEHDEPPKRRPRTWCTADRLVRRDVRQTATVTTSPESALRDRAIQRRAAPTTTTQERDTLAHANFRSSAGPAVDHRSGWRRVARRASAAVPRMCPWLGAVLRGVVGVVTVSGWLKDCPGGRRQRPSRRCVVVDRCGRAVLMRGGTVGDGRGGSGWSRVAVGVRGVGLSWLRGWCVASVGVGAAAQCARDRGGVAAAAGPLC